MKKLLHIAVIIDDTMTDRQTVATKDKIVISRPFWHSLTPRERMDVVIHEVLHAIYLHPLFR